MTPISLGIFASANQSAAATSYESIATVSVGSGGAANVEFTSIPATFTHLQVRYISKSTFTTGTSDSLLATFNNDTGTNYSYHFLRGNGTAASASGEADFGFLWLGNQGNSGSGMSDIFGVGFCDILDYANTNKYKTIRTLQGYDSNGAGFALLSSSNWRSTSAITSIKFTFSNGNLAQYSHFALYGCKSA